MGHSQVQKENPPYASGLWHSVELFNKLGMTAVKYLDYNNNLTYLFQKFVIIKSLIVIYLKNDCAAVCLKKLGLFNSVVDS